MKPLSEVAPRLLVIQIASSVSNKPEQIEVNYVLRNFELLCEFE